MDFTGSSTISKTNYYVSPFLLHFSLWHLCSLYTSTVSKMQKLRCSRTAWFALGSAYSSSRSRTISCYQSVTSVHLLDLWIANWLIYAWDCNSAEVLINYNILDISRFPQAACVLFSKVCTNMECRIPGTFSVMHFECFSVLCKVCAEWWF